MDTRKIELNVYDERIFRLNMMKLADLLPLMKLTVDERLMLQELLKSFFGKDPPPQLPWRERKHDQVRRRMKTTEE